jgi:hypothetical protein
VLLAHAVAVVHAAAVLFMLTGALLAVHRSWVLVVHAPVALAVLGVNLAGAACPLTTLELWLRLRAGEPGYSDGFLGHHLFGPLGIDVAATGIQLGIYAVASGLNALGYGLVVIRVVRAARGRRPRCGPGESAGGSPPGTHETARARSGRHLAAVRQAAVWIR